MTEKREEDAQAYEHLCQRVRKVMSILKPRTQEVEDCLAYLEHDKEELNTALSLLMGICGEVIPSWKEWFDQVAKGERHISHAGRIISECDYPIIRNEFFRFMCIDFETGYEFQQPYFAVHTEEAFKEIENRKEYLKKTRKSMTIETKYNIGDEVWAEFADIPIQCVITDIEEIKAGEMVLVAYSVSATDGRIFGTRFSGELFPTKEELLKNL